jgi:response regulator RpfG family c-di-GMP phosphodiesterase/HD-like signal output (HDOD) protein
MGTERNAALMTFKIMLVDEDPTNLRLLERLFGRDYQVLTAASGHEAVCLLEQHDVALIITDQRMSDMTGIELLNQTTSLRPHMIRIILAGHADTESLVEAINSGQVYRYVKKPWDSQDLRLTAARALQHYEANRSRYELEAANKRLTRRLREMSQGVVRAIVDSLEAKDYHVYGHARRVSGYALAIGRRMRLSAPQLEQLSLAALMHDVGKIGTPDHILLKPAALNEEERAAVRLHAERGARLLAGLPEMEDVAAAVRHHHEDYDGRGYPEGLAGERIPIASRVIRVADTYDAMTSPRPFRDALSHATAVGELLKGAGTLFDPEAVRAFCGLEALAKIRRAIAQGDFGSRILSGMTPVDLEELTPQELAREAEAEPALAAAVLRAANAGRYAESPTASLQTACARLGAPALRELLEGACGRERVSYEAKVLRDHSRRCALAARLLAEKTGFLEAQEAYTTGLLHDVGEALLLSLFPEQMENIVWFDDACARIEREVAAFGVDHAQVGQWILEACGVRRELTAAVQTHHDMIRISDPAALLLQVADAIARARDSSEVASLDAFSPDRLAALKVSGADLARIHELTTEIVGERFDCVPA